MNRGSVRTSFPAFSSAAIRNLVVECEPIVREADIVRVEEVCLLRQARPCPDNKRPDLEDGDEDQCRKEEAVGEKSAAATLARGTRASANVGRRPQPDAGGFVYHEPVPTAWPVAAAVSSSIIVQQQKARPLMGRASPP